MDKEGENRQLSELRGRIVEAIAKVFSKQFSHGAVANG